MKHCVLIVLAVVIGYQPAAAQILPTPDAIADLKVVADPQISRNGRWMAYTVATPQRQGKPPRSRIWHLPADGSEPARPLPMAEDIKDESDDTHPRWSADARQLNFISTRPVPDAGHTQEPGKQQVWQMEAEGGIPYPVTRSPGEVGAFAFSHDRRQLAYLAVDPLPEQRKIALEAMDDAIEVEKNRQFSRLWVLTPGQSNARALTGAGIQVHDVAWSADGLQLAARISDGTSLNEYWYRSRIVLLDARSGEVQKIVESHAAAFPLQYSPDGTRLLYARLGRNGISASLIVHTLSDGQDIILADHWPGTLWLARWQDDDILIAQGLRGVRGAFLRIDTASGEFKELARPQIPHEGFTVATTGLIAYLGISDQQPPEVWTLDEGRVRVRSNTNPQVADWAHAPVREISWMSSHDDRRIYGILVTPPGWQPDHGALPALVQIHGGPVWAWWSGWLGSWHEWAQLFATRGYAVFLPNPRGSEGQGRDFTELVRGDWGGGDFRDILDGVDVLEREGVIDPQRMAIGGWSYGGYMAAWAAAHSARFKAAIVGAGVIDAEGMALTTDIPDFMPRYFGDPLQNRETYDHHSPLRHAHKITIPVLILHGERDERVPLAQGQMLYRALKFNRTVVEMVVYPREPHLFLEYEHQRDIQERVLEFMQKNLGRSKGNREAMESEMTSGQTGVVAACKQNKCMLVRWMDQNGFHMAFRHVSSDFSCCFIDIVENHAFRYCL